MTNSMTKPKTLLTGLVITSCLLLGAVNLYLWHSNTGLTTQSENRHSQLAWFQKALATPPQPKTSIDDSAPTSPLALMKKLELEAKRANIDDLLTRMKQLGERGVELQFDAISFNHLLAWFEQVYLSTGLQPRQVSVQRHSLGNKVAVRAVYF